MRQTKTVLHKTLKKQTKWHHTHTHSNMHSFSLSHTHTFSLFHIYPDIYTDEYRNRWVKREIKIKKEWEYKTAKEN